MMDLNVEIASSDSSSCGDEKVLLMAVEKVEDAEDGAKLIGKAGGSKGGEEEEHSAGTSDSSSVVNVDKSPPNAGDENSSSAAAAAFVFDVFKKNKEESSTSPSELVTRQLFPVRSGGASELGLGALTMAAAPRTQWLNLSFARGDGGGSGESPMAGEFRNFQPQKQQQQVRKSRRGPRSRSSQYRGVTFYRRTGRWESHIWDCGKQVYLGGFDTAYAAARAYDRAAIKFRGVDADINFSTSDYEEDMKQMGNLTKEEFVHILRRQSTSFSRGNRALGLQKCSRWDARMCQFLGKKVHDSVVMQYNNQESLANFEHSGCEGDVVLGAFGEGGGSYDLDLNLGMAPPSGDSKRIKVAGHYRFEAPRGELLMVDSSHVSAPNKRLPVWPSMYPSLLSSSEGKAMEKRRVEAPTCLNIGWQIPSNGNRGGKSASPLLPLMFSSNAASSGFSSSSSSSSHSNSSSSRLLHNSPAVLQNPIPQLLVKRSSINTNPFPSFSFDCKRDS